MINEASARWILLIHISSHREALTLFELQIDWGDESSVGVTSPHKIFTNICLALDHVWIFARTGWRCLPWEGAKSYKWGANNWRVERRRGERYLWSGPASNCCYNFYRNKCFVSLEYGGESSLSGRLYLYGTLTSQAFITLEDAREISS